ncbi:jg15768 [Pararge aegeria aegeria]|uniref:Jg15768 protein n=1 Tax=Pararge aegeria aegeria TaxID=348720 RepID=A0A8S4RHV4_9NEOP|nr:jg15768 [Pararge aegeria aegeria]
MSGNRGKNSSTTASNSLVTELLHLVVSNTSRSANKQEIVKAYRKAAQKWHPDNFQGDEKKIAEKKFIDVAAAKEVLTDPDKRAQFDAGSDPLDPEAARGFQGNPFQHFQHGSPFQFKFHFN